MSIREGRHVAGDPDRAARALRGLGLGEDPPPQDEQHGLLRVLQEAELVEHGVEAVEPARGLLSVFVRHGRELGGSRKRISTHNFRKASWGGWQLTHV